MKNNTKEIVFTLDSSLKDLVIPKHLFPQPARKTVPKWYKDMEEFISGSKPPMGYQAQNELTIKKCMPVFDAITTGYILPAYCDISVNNPQLNTPASFEWSNKQIPEVITFHPAYQLQISNKEENTIVGGYKDKFISEPAPKWRNIWSIRTPKGYSCLFLNPLHRPHNGFTFLEGIVDTDSYVNPVNFPFLFDKSFVGTIEAGTPLIQVIPFRRDDFKMRIGDANDIAKNAEVRSAIVSQFMGVYRQMFRSHKNYL